MTAESTQRRVVSPASRIAAYSFTALGHLAGVAVVSIFTASIFLSPSLALDVVDRTMGDLALREISTPLYVLHVGLSACFWALGFIGFLYGRVRLQEHKKAGQRAIQLAKGTIITETLVVLPVFFLLLFGMSQMSVNIMTGILANVAVSESARAYWLWQPEAQVSRNGVTTGMALDRARIAAAAVMTPIAPGDAGLDSPTLASDAAKKMRNALVASHLGPLAQFAPADTGEAAWVLGTLYTGDLGAPLYTRHNQSVWRALDGGPFVLRTSKKFTHAYHATEVAALVTGGRTGVTLTYHHMIAMPLVGRVFGEFRTSPGGTDDGIRPGYYSDFVRAYGFKTQTALPNAEAPNNPGVGSWASSGGFFSAVADAFPW